MFRHLCPFCEASASRGGDLLDGVSELRVTQFEYARQTVINQKVEMDVVTFQTTKTEIKMILFPLFSSCHFLDFPHLSSLVSLTPKTVSTE